MVTVSAENGTFKVSGSFDYGYAGVYRDAQIKINGTFDEVREWKCIADAIDPQNCTESGIAAVLTACINDLEQKVQHRIKKLNDEFLLALFSDMVGPAIEFWEYDALTVREFMPEGTEDEIWQKVYQPADDAIQAFYTRCREAKKEGKTEEIDAEALLREQMPMFRWDYFPGGVVPEYLHIGDHKISIQFSDDLGGVILCHACAEFDMDLISSDWQNF